MESCDILFYRFSIFNRKSDYFVSFGFLFLLLISVGFVELTVDKPERILLDFLSKPFAPLDGASEECLKDSSVYLKELNRYTPWALQSEYNLLNSFLFITNFIFYFETYFYFIFY